MYACALSPLRQFVQKEKLVIVISNWLDDDLCHNYHVRPETLEDFGHRSVLHQRGVGLLASCSCAEHGDKAGQHHVDTDNKSSREPTRPCFRCLASAQRKQLHYQVACGSVSSVDDGV